jgi:putative ABC transport system permease protein
MVKNYLLITMRNLWRNKILSGINICGLSLGLACCMIIFLYTKDELSYDRFHTAKDQIYRITARLTDGKGNEEFKTVKTSLIQGPSFKSEIPEIRDFVRLSSSQYVFRLNNQIFMQEFKFADENFFSVFSFPLLNGDPQKVLKDLHSLVLTDEAATKYFGSTNVLGKTLEIQVNGKFEPFIISGIARRSPQNSTIKFDMILPMKFQEKINPDTHWLNFFMSTFLVLDSKANPSAVVNKMARVYLDKAGKQIQEAKAQGNFTQSVSWGLQPLLQIHLSQDYDAEDELSDASSPTYSFILTGIALFILLIACINFINLTIAQSMKRSKEIGIRKVMGGQRAQLSRQFLGESYILCLIAFALATVLTSVILPAFNELANKRLNLSYLLDIPLVAGFVGLYLLTGFAAGFYPALVLSGYNPVQTLYRQVKLAGKNYLARSLIVVQFALAAILIISTFFLYQQFQFLTHTPLGYNDKNLVVVDADWDAGRAFADPVKTKLKQRASIRQVGVHNRGREGTVAQVDGKEIKFDYEHIDGQYLPTLQIPIVQGRNFSPDFPSDSTHSVLINETFARQAGWRDPIGKTVYFSSRNRKLTVIGVVKDFHYRPLNEEIGPQLFSSEPEGNASEFYIKIDPSNSTQTLHYIEATFKGLAPFYPFTYYFKEESNLNAYKTALKWEEIISFASVLTISISCIGLLGLTALFTEQRAKEIGIRKVLGATVGSIVQMVSSNFLSLVLLANLIALPVSWWAVHKWLQNFAYHIDIHWWMFAIAVVATMAIALFTVGLRAMMAAMVNPTTSIRTQ